MSPTAAKAAKSKRTRAKKPAPTKTPALPVAQVVREGWPPDLSDETAQALFDAVENGETIKQAAASLGMKGNTVYVWRRRYPAFAERLNEAEEVGFEMAVDSYREITASDRDSAAGAQVAITVLDKFLAKKRPERFHTNPFKPSPANGDGFVLGVVVVPAKQQALPTDSPRDVIDSTAIVIPPKATTA